MNETLKTQSRMDLGSETRKALYKGIFNHRDVRGQFESKPIPPDILSRVLYTAHHAPSAEFMQPWNFTVIQSRDVRKKIHERFKKAHTKAAEMFPEEKKETYQNLKLEDNPE